MSSRFIKTPFVTATLFALVFSWCVCVPVMKATAADHTSATRNVTGRASGFKGVTITMLVLVPLLLKFLKSSKQVQEGLGDQGEDYYETEYYTLYDLADYCDPLTNDNSSDDDDDGGNNNQSGKTPTIDDTEFVDNGNATPIDVTETGTTISAVKQTFFERSGSTSASTASASTRTAQTLNENTAFRSSFMTELALQSVTNGMYVQTAGVATLRNLPKQADNIAKAPNMIAISRQNTGAEEQNLYALGNLSLAVGTGLRLRTAQIALTAPLETKMTTSSSTATQTAK